MPNEVRNNTQAGRYEILVDGELAGIADYAVRGDVVVLPHTEIDRSRRGHGLGAELVQFALDDIRASGRTIVPSCWYVAQFVDENPGYRDLLAA
jgi:predicted GNAT family acetyltransferase